MKNLFLVFLLICGTESTVWPLQTFLADFKQFFAASDSPEKIEAFKTACCLSDQLQKISVDLAAVKLFEVQNKFYGLDKKFSGVCCQDLDLAGLRTLKGRIDQFYAFIEKFENKNKSLLHSQELELLNEIKEFCLSLKNDLLKEENFEIDFTDRVLDTLIDRPAAWIKKNPGIVALPAVPAALFLLSLTGAFESVPAQSSDGSYVPKVVHVEGIPDGVYSEEDIARQTAADCGAAAIARALQRIEYISAVKARDLQRIKCVSDVKTREFRQRMYKEMEPIYRNVYEEYCRTECCPDIGAMYLKSFSAVPRDSIAVFDNMNYGLVEKLAARLNENIVCVNCSGVFWLANREWKGPNPPNNFYQNHWPKLFEFRDDLKYPVGSTIYIVCGPVIGHYLFYEVKKTAPSSSPGSWFTIRCDDSAPNYENRRGAGAYFLYNFLNCNPIMSP